MSTPSKKRKPAGELVWVIDGKTPYMAQVLEPLAYYKSENEGEEDEDIEVEVEWTHNGKHEWVTLDRVQLEIGSSRRRKPSIKVASPTPTKASSTPAKSTKQTPKKTTTPAPKKKATPAKKVSPNSEPSSPSSKKAKSPSKMTAPAKETKEVSSNPLSKKRGRDEISPEPESSPLADKASLMQHSEEPPPKRQMKESNSGFLSGLALKASDAKMALVSGFQEIYKELMGPSS